MEQMKKGISNRDKALLLVVALLAVGAVYYFLVFRPTTDQIESLRAQQEQVQLEVDTLNTKLQLLAKMNNELPGLRESNMPVAAYDNLKPVMAALNNIMSPSQQFDISFDTSSAEGGSIIRRQITINFLCSTYRQARDIVTNLHNVPYRCQISMVSYSSEQAGGGVMGEKEGDINRDPVRGSVLITFFENVQV